MHFFLHSLCVEKWGFVVLFFSLLRKRRHSSQELFWVLSKVPISALILWLPTAKPLKAWWTWSKLLTSKRTFLPLLYVSFWLLLADAKPKGNFPPRCNWQGSLSSDQSYTMWKLFGYFSKCHGVSGMPSVQGASQTAALTLAFKQDSELPLWHNGLHQLIPKLSNIKKWKLSNCPP